MYLHTVDTSYETNDYLSKNQEGKKKTCDSSSIHVLRLIVATIVNDSRSPLRWRVKLYSSLYVLFVTCTIVFVSYIVYIVYRHRGRSKFCKIILHRSKYSTIQGRA